MADFVCRCRARPTRVRGCGRDFTDGRRVRLRADRHRTDRSLQNISEERLERQVRNLGYLEITKRLCRRIRAPILKSRSRSQQPLAELLGKCQTALLRELDKMSGYARSRAWNARCRHSIARGCCASRGSGQRNARPPEAQHHWTFRSTKHACSTAISLGTMPIPRFSSCIFSASRCTSADPATPRSDR
jgi:hypothetical protein